MAVLGLFRPFKELHLSQVIPDIVYKFILLLIKEGHAAGGAVG